MVVCGYNGSDLLFDADAILLRMNAKTAVSLYHKNFMKMKKLNKIFAIVVLSLTLSMVTSNPLPAQCPMCKMSAESNLRAGGTAGAGLNAGILYMLAMPYLLVATMGLVWYRNRKREEDEDFVSEIQGINEID